jgi:hypothetical protein
MSYVPGYQHDLFLSYERGDSAWVEGFRSALSRLVRDQLGQHLTVWQDKDNIRFGQDWPDEIHRGISQAAAFLAVCSASYFQSEWCTHEYSKFVPESGLEPLKAGAFYRFQKVVKAPDVEGYHREFFENVQRTDFFDDKSGEEYVPGSREFENCVRRVASGLTQLLVTMRNQKLKLYVASVAPDLEDEWKQLRTDLFDHLFNVRPNARLTSAFSDGALRRELDESKLAIFLLGAVRDNFVQRQIDIAREVGVPMVFWIHPRKSKNATPEQRALLEELKSATDLPAGSQFVGAKTPQNLIDDVVELLAAGQQSPSTTPPRSVYLLHDSSRQHEVERARRVRALLGENKLAVLPSEAENVSMERHEQLMRRCEGLLLYRGAVPGPDRWLREYLGDVLLADDAYGRKAAKTLLLENPDQVKSLGVEVVPYLEPLTALHLQPFIARMQQPEQANAVS